MITTKVPKNKKWIIRGIIAILLFVSICCIASAIKNGEENTSENTQTNNTIQTLKWNSDATKIDDRLENNDPIFMILSRGYLDSGYYAATVFTLYNDGKYVTDYIGAESEEVYMEDMQGTKLVELIKEDYENATTSDMANMFTEDKKPADVRNTYLKQYDITSYDMDNQVNMRSEGSSVEIYGVVYDEKLEPTLIGYYYEAESVTKQILDEKGLEVLTWITEEEASTATSK